MDYIVLDLEWNQSSNEAGVNKDIKFEIIEIGAMKLNGKREQTDKFSELIKPQVYHELHKITGNLIHLKMEELDECRSFQEVMGDFLTWCGQDYIFCTWGTQDLTELQNNMQYYGMQPLSDGPIRFLDVQKLFSLAYEDGKSRRALEYAVDFLHIEKDIPFHRAFADAYYTGKVLSAIQDEKVLTMYSYDVFHPPKNAKEEVSVVFDTYAKYISRVFPDKAAALRDREVISSKCYLCHRNLKKKIRWFCPAGRHYYCLAYCERHGYLKGKIRIKKVDEEQVYIVKTTKLISAKEAEELMQRQEHAKELRRNRRKRK